MTDLVTIFFTIRSGSEKISRKLIDEFYNISEIDFVKNLNDHKIYIHASAKIMPSKKRKFKNDLEKKLKRKVKILGMTE